jgi:hypothetical protein
MPCTVLAEASSHSNCLEFRVVLEEVAARRSKSSPVSLGPRQIEGELLQLFGVALEVKAEALLEPEHVGNQRRTLFIDLVAVQQPEQRDQQHQQQTDRQLEDRQIPVRPPQRVGRRRSLW